MNDKKQNKIWAEHIIHKFGRKSATKFALSEFRCPCNFLDWNCIKCKFDEKEGFGCYIGDDYDAYISNDWNHSQRKLKKRFKNIKKFILKVE